MRADRVDVSWDSDKKKWAIRIQVGEEIVRRFYDMPKSATEQTICSAAQEAIQNEGYEPDVSRMTIHR